MKRMSLWRMLLALILVSSMVAMAACGSGAPTPETDADSSSETGASGTAPSEGEPSSGSEGSEEPPPEDPSSAGGPDPESSQADIPTPDPLPPESSAAPEAPSSSSVAPEAAVGTDHPELAAFNAELKAQGYAYTVESLSTEGFECKTVFKYTIGKGSFHIFEFDMESSEYDTIKETGVVATYSYFKMVYDVDARRQGFVLSLGREIDTGVTMDPLKPSTKLSTIITLEKYENIKRGDIVDLFVNSIG